MPSRQMIHANLSEVQGFYILVAMRGTCFIIGSKTLHGLHWMSTLET